MPGGFRIDAARALVLTRGWGVVSDRDIRMHARGVGEDPRFLPHFAQLADFRGITDVQASPAAVSEVARLNPFGLGSRRAVVVGADVTYGVARMYQMMRGDTLDELEVFRDFDRALDWLGLAGLKTELLAALAAIPPLPGL